MAEAASFLVIASVGNCPNPGPYTQGFQLAVENTHPTNAITATVRVNTTPSNPPIYNDHVGVRIPARGYSQVLVVCSQNPGSGTQQSLQVLSAQFS